MDFDVVNKERWDDGLEKGITYTIRYYDSDDGNHYEFFVYGYGGQTEFDCIDWENSVQPSVSHDSCLHAINGGIYYAKEIYLESV